MIPATNSVAGIFPFPMASITGQYYPPNSSSRSDARLVLNNNRYQLESPATDQRTGAVDELTISPRVGNIARHITWPDGAAFVSTDNAAIDRVLDTKNHSSKWLHRLESSWRLALPALVVLPLIVFCIFRWGIPAAAAHIAMRLPVNAMEIVSTGALKTLDRLYFSPSQIDIAQQTEVHRRFEILVNSLPQSEFNYRLYFRRMHGMPNAMALPSGEIIVTDAFVNMARPGQLEAVLYHEIGHVERRHGMQQVLSASTVSAMVTIAFGDTTALGDMAVSVPVFLMQASYSRSKELEADNYAFTQMTQAGIDPGHFAQIIRKLGADDDTDNETLRYFSTHPLTAERAENAQRASAAFHATRQ